MSVSATSTGVKYSVFEKRGDDYRLIGSEWSSNKVAAAMTAWEKVYDPRDGGTEITVIVLSPEEMQPITLQMTPQVKA